MQGPKKARKAPKSLPINEVARRIRRMVKLIDEQTRIALEVRASLESANSLIQEHSGRQFYAADSVTSIQGSQAMFLTLILAKLFEMPRRRRGETYARRYNRSDAASIPLLLRLVRQRRARAYFGAKARHWTAMLPSWGDKNARACEDAIDKALSAYDSLRKTKVGRAAILRLRRFRNNLLAHLLIIPKRGVNPTYGEIFRLVDVAREVSGHVRLAIEGLNTDLAGFEAEKIRVAEAFWEAALPAAMAAKQPRSAWRPRIE
jgi:hypothetical protein